MTFIHVTCFDPDWESGRFTSARITKTVSTSPSQSILSSSCPQGGWFRVPSCFKWLDWESRGRLRWLLSVQLCPNLSPPIELSIQPLMQAPRNVLLLGDSLEGARVGRDKSTAQNRLPLPRLVPFGTNNKSDAAAFRHSFPFQQNPVYLSSGGLQSPCSPQQRYSTLHDRWRTWSTKNPRRNLVFEPVQRSAFFVGRIGSDRDWGRDTGDLGPH